jgi:hypothetical protein
LGAFLIFASGFPLPLPQLPVALVIIIAAKHVTNLKSTALKGRRWSVQRVPKRLPFEHLFASISENDKNRAYVTKRLRRLLDFYGNPDFRFEYIGGK